MHDYSMDVLGKYIKKNYSDFDNMSCQELKELYCLSKVMKNILEADLKYHSIVAMEEGDNSSVEMEWDEFVHRFKQMYADSDTATRNLMKTEIMKMIS